MVGLRRVVTGSPSSDYKEMEASEVSSIGSKVLWERPSTPSLSFMGTWGTKLSGKAEDCLIVSEEKNPDLTNRILYAIQTQQSKEYQALRQVLDFSSLKNPRQRLRKGKAGYLKEDCYKTSTLCHKSSSSPPQRTLPTGPTSLERSL